MTTPQTTTTTTSATTMTTRATPTSINQQLRGHRGHRDRRPPPHRQVPVRESAHRRHPGRLRSGCRLRHRPQSTHRTGHLPVSGDRHERAADRPARGRENPYRDRPRPRRSDRRLQGLLHLRRRDARPTPPPIRRDHPRRRLLPAPQPPRRSILITPRHNRHQPALT